MKFEMYQCVSVNKDVKNIKKGRSGTIVDIFKDGTYLVEFADCDGVTEALLELNENDISETNTEDK